MTLAEAFPKLHCIVQDYAGLEPQFKSICPPALQSRITFQQHDFFTPQPVKGASVYLLKHILHDWPDDLAIKIIQNIVPAMAPDSRIIIMDGVVPLPGTAPKELEKLSTSLDLQMMSLMNAHERTKADWREMISKADARLVVKAFVQPPGSVPNIIEVSFE